MATIAETVARIPAAKKEKRPEGARAFLRTGKPATTESD
jgi:hypothetical protein